MTPPGDINILLLIEKFILVGGGQTFKAVELTLIEIDPATE